MRRPAPEAADVLPSPRVVYLSMNKNEAATEVVASPLALHGGGAGIRPAGRCRRP